MATKTATPAEPGGPAGVPWNRRPTVSLPANARLDGRDPVLEHVVTPPRNEHDVRALLDTPVQRVSEVAVGGEDAHRLTHLRLVELNRPPPPGVVEPVFAHFFRHAGRIEVTAEPELNDGRAEP